MIRTGHIELGTEILVYRNLHNGLLSVVQKGKVVAHLGTVMLCNVRFIVRETGRQRVLSEKRKNVHAFVKGLYMGGAEELMDMGFDNLQKVRYNPYKYETFVCEDKPIHSAEGVIVLKTGEMYLT